MPHMTVLHWQVAGYMEEQASRETQRSGSWKDRRMKGQRSGGRGRGIQNNTLVSGRKCKRHAAWLGVCLEQSCEMQSALWGGEIWQGSTKQFKAVGHSI